MSVANGTATGNAQEALPVGPWSMKELVGIMTATGGITLTAQSRNVLRIDPGGAARTLLLPPEAVGLWFVIINAADAAETITLKDDSNTDTIGTVTEDQGGFYWCDGTAWQRGGTFTMVT
jgi:hypothetical protein